MSGFIAINVHIASLKLIMYKQSPNYDRLIIKSLLSLFRTWNKWWLGFQLARGSLFNPRCIISSIIVPSLFSRKMCSDFSSWTSRCQEQPPSKKLQTLGEPLSSLVTWPGLLPSTCFTRRHCLCQGDSPEHHLWMESYSYSHSCKNLFSRHSQLRSFLTWLWHSFYVSIIFLMFYDCLHSLYPLCVGTTSKFVSCKASGSQLST